MTTWQDTWGEQVDAINRKMIEYSKIILPNLNNDLDLSQEDVLIMVKNGYPWMSAVLEGVKQKKDELIRLIPNYLNNHYSV